MQKKGKETVLKLDQQALMDKREFPAGLRTDIDTKIIDVINVESPEVLSCLLKEPSDCLRNGGMVAFPTETVYGLGADALNVAAAQRIYKAKGRPSDNPLIVHVAEVEDMEKLAYPNEQAYILAQAFWPGPLTIILPKREIVPRGTTGGLDTVAVRMPSHPAALHLIRQSGVYIAAPSANISGRPSPTRAGHVVEDMAGRIDYIVDGGPVGIGIESTIVDVSGDVPVILRPGFITKNMLEQMVGSVVMDPALEKPADGLRPKAPGMKYTHYAPRGKMTLVELAQKQTDCLMDTVNNVEKDFIKQQHPVIEKICALSKEKRDAGYKVGIMTSRETGSCYEGYADVVICVGDRKEENTVAAGLYASLRDFDKEGVDYIYAESFRGEGLSHAIMNRLLKAAGQRVIRV